MIVRSQNAADKEQLEAAREQGYDKVGLDALVEWVAGFTSGRPIDLPSVRDICRIVAAECEYAIGLMPKEAVPLRAEDRAALQERPVPITAGQYLVLVLYRASHAAALEKDVLRALEGAK